MKNRFLLILYIGILLPAIASAQASWKADDIPDSLKNDGQSAVVRLYNVVYKALTPESGMCTFRKVVTILDKRGEDYAFWDEITEEGSSSITSFRGVIYDKDGSVFKKLKKSDMHILSYNDAFASNTKGNYIEPPTMPSFPYTVEYEWDVRYTKNLLSYPMFGPIDGSHESMQECHYTLVLNAGTEMDYRCLNTNPHFTKTPTAETDTYTWIIPGQRAILDDEYSPSSLFVYPYIMAHPSHFTYGGVAGSLENWKKFGDWSCTLAKDRDNLPPSEQEKVKALTDGLATPMEKIGALYKYLGEKTRYVSIQLGIGGYQPMLAEEVARTGFGDCKALSNYMRAMLKAIGIPSYLTTISTKYADLFTDYPNFNQLDHMILCVPMQKDSLWLDCTCAADMPFPNTPYGLKGHECIVLTDEGAKIQRIPASKPEENAYITTAEVNLAKDGTITNSIFSVTNRGGGFLSLASLIKAEDKKKYDAVSHLVDLNNSKVTNLKIEKNTEGMPSVTLSCGLSASYGRKSGTRLFVPANPFSSVSTPHFTANRRIPIVRGLDVVYIDTITLHLPEKVAVESMPDWTPKEGVHTVLDGSKYGQVESSVTNIDDRTVRIVSKVHLNKGRYPVSEKDDFTAFFKALSKRLDENIVLVVRP